MQKREGIFFQYPRAQKTVNSGYKKSTFLTLSAIKNGMNYFIRSVSSFATKSLS